MEHNELNVVISRDSATVTLRYNGQEYTEKWSRVGKGNNIHMESNGAQVEMPDALTQSIDPKFVAKMMDTLNTYDQ